MGEAFISQNLFTYFSQRTGSATQSGFWPLTAFAVLAWFVPPVARPYGGQDLLRPDLSSVTLARKTN